MPCVRKAPQLTLAMGNYSMIDDFYIMDLVDINVVLGIQWLSALGPITTDYRTIEMGFNTPEGTRVVLRGMSNEAPRIISSHRMEALFRRDHVAYAVECLITTQKSSHEGQQYHVDIQHLLGKHGKVFGEIPLG